MNIRSDLAYHNATLGTTPQRINFVGSIRPIGMVGMKIHVGSLVGGSPPAGTLMVVGVDNNGNLGSSSAPTMSPGTSWDEAAPGRSIECGHEYADSTKDYWVAMTTGTGDITVFPIV